MHQNYLQIPGPDPKSMSRVPGICILKQELLIHVHSDLNSIYICAEK